MAAPQFDPSQPFEPIPDVPVKAPEFDASKPFEALDQQDSPANVDPDLFGAYRDLHRAMESGDRLGLATARARVNDLVNKAQAQDSLSGTTAASRFGLGVGRGMERTGLNVAEVAGHLPGLDGVKDASRAALADVDDTSRPLMDTWGGKLGNFSGEVAATLPIGMGAGSAAKALLGGAAKIGVPAAKALAPYIAGALEGATQGAVTAGPDNRVEGGLVGGAIGGSLPLGAKFLKALGHGVVEATPAAKYLMNKGVRGLTIGQIAPNSALAQIEEAATGAPGLGEMLKKQRALAPTLWQDAVLREVQPSPAPLAGNSANDKLANIYDSFEPAYAPIKATEMVPQTSAGAPLRGIAGRAAKEAEPSMLVDAAGRPIPTTPAAAGVAPKPSAFESALRDPAATEDEAGRVRRILEDQTSLLPEMRPGQAPGQVSAKSLLQMRSNIRGEAANFERQGEFVVARMLRKAEQQVTDSLESQLPPAERAQLAATDAQYAKYKTLENAVANSKDQAGGFTPTQLSTAIKQASEKGDYARGAGGPLRELAKAGKEVLEAKTPLTGARILTAGGPMISTPMALFSLGTNAPVAKQALLGTLPGQRFVAGAIDRLGEQRAMVELLRRSAINSGSAALSPEPASP